MGRRVVQFLAIAFTALALVPAGAHLFELPNQIGLPQDDYFVAEGIYRGWALFGVVLFGALLAKPGSGDHGPAAARTVPLRARGPPPRRRHHRGLLHLDLSGEPGDEQLDRRPGQLGGAAPAMGIRPRGERGAHLPRALRRDMAGVLLTRELS